MTQRNRQFLKQEFQDGERPSGGDFADVMDSYLNKVDDGLAIGTDGTLVLARGLGLGDSAAAVAGTLRFNSGVVQVHNGTTWVGLASSGMGFQGIGLGTDIAYTAGGNVGILDSSAVPPTFRLEVDLGPNTAEAERVRFGNVTCNNGTGAFAAFAYLSHRNRANNNEFALRQSDVGVTHLNAAATQILSLRQGGTNVRLGITTDGHVVVGSETNLSGAPGTAVFQVNGDAFVPAGRIWGVSDARVKDDVRDLEPGLAELRQVRPVRFRYNGEAGTPRGRPGIGIIGQEIEKIFPEMVQHVPNADGSGDELLVYDGAPLTYVLINAVKELAKKVELLESRLARSDS